MVRSRSQSRSRSHSKSHDFPLMLIIPQAFSESFSNSENLQRLRSSCSADRLVISESLNENNPELILIIEGPHDKKVQSLTQILNEFLIIGEYDFKKNGLTMLIPSHIVSVLIAVSYTHLTLPTKA